MKNAKQLKVMFILLSLFYIFIGVALLIWPETSVALIRYLLSGALIVYGLVRIIGFFQKNKTPEGRGFGLVAGVISIFFGALLLLYPGLLLVVPFIVGLSIIFNSIIKLQMAFEFKTLGDKHWWVTLLLALFTGILGGLILFNLGTFGSTFVIVFAAITLIFDGLVNLWAFISLNRLSKKAQ